MKDWIENLFNDFPRNATMSSSASRFRLVSVVLCSLFLLPAKVAALPPQAGPENQSFGAAHRTRVFNEVRTQVDRYYVFPEKRLEIVHGLDEAKADGRLDLDSPMAYASALSVVLATVSRDKHLHLTYDPNWYEYATRPVQAEVPEDPAQRARRVASDNFGLTEMRVLPGNIRYLKITGFGWEAELTGNAYDAAMSFLGQGEAVILDLRGNSGGDHSATRYLISHFLDPDVLLYTFESKKARSWESRTADHLSTGRLKGKPLYVLMDRRTISAGEDVAYQVQQYKLGELVGAKTAGAANNPDHIAIAPGFRLSLSVGRPVHPVSQTNWEGIGINPTLPSDPLRALEVAHLHMLDRLAKDQTRDPVTQAEILWAQENVRAALNPVTLTQAQLQAVAGNYGENRVRLVDGVLVLERPERDPSRLRPMSSDGLFALENVYPLRVRLANDQLAMYWLAAPEPLVHQKTPAPR